MHSILNIRQLEYQELILSSCQQQSTVWVGNMDRIGACSRLFCIVHQKDISFAETCAKILLSDISTNKGCKLQLWQLLLD